MRRILRCIDSISEWSGKLTSYLVLAMVGVIFYEVMMRYVVVRPTIWAHESSLFLFGTFVLLGGAYTLKYGAHVNVDIVYSRFSPRGRAIIDLVTFIFFCIFMAVLLWKGGHATWKAISIMERSESAWGPVTWPQKIMIPIGAFLLTLQGLAKFVRDLSTARGGGKR